MKETDLLILTASLTELGTGAGVWVEEFSETVKAMREKMKMAMEKRMMMTMMMTM